MGRGAEGVACGSGRLEVDQVAEGRLLPWPIVDWCVFAVFVYRRLVAGVEGKRIYVGRIGGNGRHFPGQWAD